MLFKIQATNISTPAFCPAKNETASRSGIGNLKTNAIKEIEKTKAVSFVEVAAMRNAPLVFPVIVFFLSLVTGMLPFFQAKTDPLFERKTSHFGFKRI